MSEKDFSKDSQETRGNNEPEEQETQRLDAQDETGISENGETDTAANDPKDRGVQYEQNDNWKFDASAPAAENNVLGGVNGVEFEFEQSRENNAPAPAQEVERRLSRRISYSKKSACL